MKNLFCFLILTLASNANAQTVQSHKVICATVMGASNQEAGTSKLIRTVSATGYSQIISIVAAELGLGFDHHFHNQVCVIARRPLIGMTFAGVTNYKTACADATADELGETIESLIQSNQKLGYGRALTSTAYKLGELSDGLLHRICVTSQI